MYIITVIKRPQYKNIPCKNVRLILNSDTKVTTYPQRCSKIPIRQIQFMYVGYVSEFIELIHGSKIPVQRAFHSAPKSKH